MLITVKDIIDVLEKEVPSKYACKWDNVGLLVGAQEYKVNKVMIALDATDDVVNQAIESKVDLIITHHPIIFKEIKKVTDQDFIGKKIISLIENKIAVFAMHTNFDACKLTDEVSKLLNISGVSLEVINMEDNLGLGKVGMLEEPMLLESYIDIVKSSLKVDMVKVFGQLDKKVSKVAISQGSGGSMISYAIAANADVLVTGDIDHHQGIDALEQGLAIIDAGHFETEKFSMDLIKNMLSLNFKWELEIIVAKENAPYQYR